MCTYVHSCNAVFGKFYTSGERKTYKGVKTMCQGLSKREARVHVDLVLNLPSV